MEINQSLINLITKLGNKYFKTQGFMEMNQNLVNCIKTLVNFLIGNPIYLVILFFIMKVKNL